MKPLTSFFRALHRLRSLGKNESGISLVEFAFSMPFLLLMISGGAELANYAITKMRVSALALQVADNASRIGEGNLLQSKKITEAQMNDLLQGALAQSGSLNINGFSNERQADNSTISNAKARIIISSLEPVYGIALAFLFLQEIPSLRTLAGGTVIVGTTLIALRYRA